MLHPFCTACAAQVDATAFEDEPEDALVPERALWAPGVGSLDGAPAASLAFDRNRIEVLRLLLAASCEPLYDSADTFDPWRSRWLAVSTARDAPNAKLLRRPGVPFWGGGGGTSFGRSVGRGPDHVSQRGVITKRGERPTRVRRGKTSRET